MNWKMLLEGMGCIFGGVLWIYITFKVKKGIHTLKDAFTFEGIIGSGMAILFGIGLIVHSFHK